METAIQKTTRTRNADASAAVDFDTEREVAALRARVRKLEEVVLDIHKMQMTSSAGIQSMSKLALSYMERPEAYRQTESLAAIFEQIWGTSEQAEAYTLARVEDADLDTRDPRAEARSAARVTAESAS